MENRYIFFINKNVSLQFSDAIDRIKFMKVCGIDQLRLSEDSRTCSTNCKLSRLNTIYAYK